MGIQRSLSRPLLTRTEHRRPSQSSIVDSEGFRDPIIIAVCPNRYTRLSITVVIESLATGQRILRQQDELRLTLDENLSASVFICASHMKADHSVIKLDGTLDDRCGHVDEYGSVWCASDTFVLTEETISGSIFVR